MLKRTNSFVGTAQFVAPEILKRGTIHMGFDTNANMSFFFLFISSSFIFQVRSLVSWLYYLSDGNRKTPVLRQVSLSIDEINNTPKADRSSYHFF